MNAEQREYPRLERQFQVKYEIVSSSLPRPVAKPSRKGWAKNISGGGLYLVLGRLGEGTTKRLIDRSSKLSLEFYLPDFQNRIKVLGEARWSREQVRWWRSWPKRRSFGVRFTYIRPEDRDCIIKYVINKRIENHLVEKSA